MPACVWSTTSETEERVEFLCSTCNRVIGFVKPGYGDPNPVPDGAGGWVPPENVLDWMDPCP
jgi:hypothetical protein